jgi:hypothetical protein
MPFLKRGKARARQNRQVVPVPLAQVTPTVPKEVPVEEPKVAKQEVTYRVPKEERLLDLPLEEEVFEEPIPESIEPEEGEYTAMPVGDPVSIGAVLKKKKKK